MGKGEGVKRLVLASASPRRRELLAMLGAPFEVRVSLAQESLPSLGEPLEQVVSRLALEKALRAAEGEEDALVLGADTLVAMNGEVMGKPATPTEAVSMLERLRGRQHRVVTGVALVDSLTGRTWVDYQASTVAMRPYSREEVLRYVASGDPMDKAGGYAIQDTAFAPAERIEGCYWNVVGLPLCLAASWLTERGLALRVRATEIAARCHECPLVPQKGG